MEQEQKYRDIVKKYDVQATGFHVGGDFEIDVARLTLIQKFIRDNFRPATPRSKKHKHSSYGLKHVVEKLMGDLVIHYVSNSELILCMIAEGYTPHFYKLDPKNPNCSFNVNLYSVFEEGYKKGKSIWKSITKTRTYDEMDRHAGNFTYDYKKPFYPKSDLYVLGYLFAKQRAHEAYPSEYSSKSTFDSRAHGYDIFREYTARPFWY